MCMPMGGAGAAFGKYNPLTPPPAAPTFDSQFSSQLSAKKPVEAPITRDNPLLSRSQRAKLDTSNAAPATGLQSA